MHGEVNAVLIESFPPKFVKVNVTPLRVCKLASFVHVEQNVEGLILSE